MAQIESIDRITSYSDETPLIQNVDSVVDNISRIVNEPYVTESKQFTIVQPTAVQPTAVQHTAVQPIKLHTESKSDEQVLTSQNLPIDVVKYIKYQPINSDINRLNLVPLSELIAKLDYQLIHNPTMHCYTVNYATMSVECKHACQIYNNLSANHTPQQLFSLSGEERDLCYYSYGPEDLKKFLTLNAHHKYTFLPMTVYPTDSANGKRHDMLIIFDNVHKKFYHFDCRNRDDYMKYAKIADKYIIDVLMFYIESIAQPYTFESTEEWQNLSVMKPYGTMGSLDFIISTAHCYLQMTMLKYYESPLGLMTILSELDPSDLFHLVYSTVMTIIHHSYNKSLPSSVLIDYTQVTPKRPAQPTTQPTNQSVTSPRQLTAVQPTTVQPTNVQPTTQSTNQQTPRPIVEKCSIM